MSNNNTMPVTQSPITLPCGAVIKNRIGKSAMTEALADEYSRATEGHVRLYKRWAHGGSGLLVTGNIQIDRTMLERPGNVCIQGKQDETQMEALRAFARAGRENGTHCWVQLSHGGRQSDNRVNMNTVGPSDVATTSPTALPGSKNRALTLDEIKDIRQRFIDAALVVKDAGFSGVQFHSAHGYLLSSFLSPLANKRTDAYGGSLENRARLLLEVVRGTRKVVGDSFPVAVKLNSADFQQGGFTVEECSHVAKWLDEAGLDLLEISGGNYESPALMGLHNRKTEEAPGNAVRQEKTNMAREAYFLKFAKVIKSQLTNTKLMVTGGFRTGAFIEEALARGDCEMIGIGRPLCGDPDCVRLMFEGVATSLPRYEVSIKVNAVLEFLTRFKLPRLVKFLGQQNFMYLNIWRMGEGEDPLAESKFSLYSAITETRKRENKLAREMKGIESVGFIKRDE